MPDSVAATRCAALLRKLGWLPGEGEYRPKRAGRKVTAYYRPTDPA